MKTCAHCGELKSKSDFYKSVKYVCKKCHIARSARRIKENPAAARESNWRQRGIQLTHAEYEERHRLQVGLCWICKQPEAVSGRLLAVDHDHETGEIRGLLCYRCNTHLGWYESHADSIQDYFQRS